MTLGRYSTVRESRATRARTLSHHTAATEPIAETALSILRAERPRIERDGCTLIGLSVGNLRNAGDGVEQLLIPFGAKDRSGLDATVDDLRERFGHQALTRASLIGRRTGFEVPKLPD